MRLTFAEQPGGRDRAAALGAQMTAEDGLANAVEAIATLIPCQNL